jgi:hypothetical protein
MIYKMQTDDNARDYFRYTFSQPLEAQLRIHQIKGILCKNQNFTTILLQNISPGGVCFCSDLSFPSDLEFTFEIRFSIAGVDKVYKGDIVWSTNKDDKVQYGTRFFISDIEQRELFQLINLHASRDRKKRL